MSEMDEREFNALADVVLRDIETRIEQCAVEVDLETQAGGVLELEFANGSKIVINRHVAAREIWIAAKSGGYHFRHTNGHWLDTRNGEELLAALARCMSEQSGAAVLLPPPRA